MIDSTTNHFFASGIVSAQGLTQGRLHGRIVFLTSICLIVLNSFVSSAANAQTNQWYWTGGTHVALSNQTPSGSWGALGVPALGNLPSDRQGATTWTDSSGNFWLFGGSGTDSIPPGGGYLNDLWKFNPSTLEWTWMGGSSAVSCIFSSNGTPMCGGPGVFGNLGVPAVGNVPSGRYGAVSWIDSNGNFWLFGGVGIDSTNTEGSLNDLWEFNPSTQLWTWVGGSSTIPNHQDGTDNVFGPLGVFDAKSIPGSRWEASGWTDGHGNLWLFGGEGYTDSELNDLWEFNPSTRLWAWMGGSNAPACRGTPCGQAGVYGAMGTPAAGNFPGGRFGAANWIDNSGEFWIVGGEGLDSAATVGVLNDVWRFDPATSLWTWMGGANLISTTNSTSVPEPRSSATSWTDPNGDLWLFGGFFPNGLQSLDSLWKFSPLLNQWTRMLPTSIPPGRGGANGWSDQSGNLWLFGGNTIGLPNSVGLTNDLWEYKLSATSSPAAAPLFSVAAGTYNSVQTVALTDTMPGATFYYTTDGKTIPTISSTKYTGPITVLSNETIQAEALVPGFSSSPVASAAYMINPPPGFILALSSTSLSVQSGQQGTVNVTLTPYSGFSSAVTFACSGMPYYASCAFSPNSVTPTGIPANTTLTISVKSQSAALRDNRDTRLAGAILAFAVCIFGWKRNRNMPYAILIMAIVVGMGMLTACGGSKTVSSGSTPTTYTVSVTAVSGSIQQSIPLSLTMN